MAQELRATCLAVPFETEVEVSTHSLAQVAVDYLPSGWTDGARWLARRINRGELKAHRFGRVLVMTDSDIEYMLDKFKVDAIEPEPAATEQDSVPEPDVDVPLTAGLSQRGRARRMRAAS